MLNWKISRDQQRIVYNVLAFCLPVQRLQYIRDALKKTSQDDDDDNEEDGDDDEESKWETIEWERNSGSLHLLLFSCFSTREEEKSFYSLFYLSVPLLIILIIPWPHHLSRIEKRTKKKIKNRDCYLANINLTIRVELSSHGRSVEASSVCWLTLDLNTDLPQHRELKIVDFWRRWWRNENCKSNDDKLLVFWLTLKVNLRNHILLTIFSSLFFFFFFMIHHHLTPSLLLSSTIVTQ